MMNLDGEFLEEVGAVTKAANLRKKEVQLNTRMHYTQRRCAHMPAPADTSLLIAAHLGLYCSMPEPQRSNFQAKPASLCSVLSMHKGDHVWCCWHALYLCKSTPSPSCG